MYSSQHGNSGIISPGVILSQLCHYAIVGTFSTMQTTSLAVTRIFEDNASSIILTYGNGIKS
jgi:hypothetical protein